MKITSSTCMDGRPIPTRYTADGEDVSPPIEWSDLPPGTKSLALLVDDPDAPGERPWVHWLLYGIDPDTHGLPEGVPRDPLPASVPGARQGVNSFASDHIGYRGPAPPPGDGPHRYRFRLHALDARPDLAAGASRDDFFAAVRGHVLGTARLTALYGR